MGFNSPVPVRLADECAKARKILNSFIDGSNNGLDQVIPRSVLIQAKGFAIFTVAKAGILVSARAGSGVVIARLPNGEWSAPTAIGTAGLGFGGQAGAEVTDFLIVLNSRAAVTSFMAAGSLNFGGNMSLAVGPLGRNAEGMGAVNTQGNVAAMYSYSKTKGLFGGVSIEGSVIVERQDANRLAYGTSVTAKQLLSGSVPIPPFAESLVAALVASTHLPGGRAWVEDYPPTAGGTGWEAEPIAPLGSPAMDRGGYAFAGMGSAGGGVNGAGGGSGGRDSALSLSNTGGASSAGGSGNRSRSGSLLATVVGRNRSSSVLSAQSTGRARGASVGSASGPVSIGIGGGVGVGGSGGASSGSRPGSPARPGLFSSVSFGRRRGNSRSFADPPVPGEEVYHSSESYNAAAPAPSALSSSPYGSAARNYTPLKPVAAPTAGFETQFQSNLSQDSLNPPQLAAGPGGSSPFGGGDGSELDLLQLQDGMARSSLRPSAAAPRADEFGSERYSIDGPPSPPRSSGSKARAGQPYPAPQISRFDEWQLRHPPSSSSAPSKKSRPFSSIGFSGGSSSKGKHQRGSDFHTGRNTYYDEDGLDVFADPDPVLGSPPPSSSLSCSAAAGASASAARARSASGSVQASEDWSALGARARAGLARTQSGNVLSSVAAGGAAAAASADRGARSGLDGDDELRKGGYVGRGIALYDFVGVEPGDLSFQQGDVILLIEKTAEANDWWTGMCSRTGKSGVFAGTYVKVVD